MREWVFAALLVLVGTGLVSWWKSDSGFVFRRDAQHFRLQYLGGVGNIGGSTDVWLEKFTIAGEWEKVALFFGYTDDYKVCTRMVEAWDQRHPDDLYRCTVAR